MVEMSNLGITNTIKISSLSRGVRYKCHGKKVWCLLVQIKGWANTLLCSYCVRWGRIREIHTYIYVLCLISEPESIFSTSGLVTSSNWFSYHNCNKMFSPDRALGFQIWCFSDDFRSDLEIMGIMTQFYNSSLLNYWLHDTM